MASFANNQTILSKANDILYDIFSNLTGLYGNLSTSNSFQPIPASITMRAADRGGNSLGLTPESGNIICLSPFLFPTLASASIVYDHGTNIQEQGTISTQSGQTPAMMKSSLLHHKDG